MHKFDCNVCKASVRGGWCDTRDKALEHITKCGIKKILIHTPTGGIIEMQKPRQESKP